MSSQPILFDSIFKMLVSSAPETKPVPAGRTSSLPQQGILGDLFAATDSPHHRDDWVGQGHESMSLHRPLGMRLMINSFCGYLQWREGEAGVHWKDAIAARVRERPTGLPASDQVRARQRTTAVSRN